MKRLLIITAAILVSTYTFADFQSSGSSQLKQLGMAFKSKPIAEPKINSNDITMGYAGQDISRKPTIAFHTATV